MDFWRQSGFHLLDRDGAGHLAITDDFLRAYLLRQEIRPEEDSGAHEKALHQRLMEEPRCVVSDQELAAIEDPDAGYNYRIWLGFRARLLQAGTLEAAYAAIFSGAPVDVPPLFIDQLAHIIVRNVLEGVDDGLQARAAELFFREQKVSLDEGRIMLADLETVQMHATGGTYGSLGRLLAEAQTSLAAVHLEVLDADNAALYWLRDQRHDYVISINYGRPALVALCRVLERWVRHFFGIEVTISAERSIADSKWAWHIGLDAQSTSVLNDLWQGIEVENGRLQRLLALFRMDFADAAVMRPDIAGRPIYLALAMDEANVVRMKPQNLLINLPLAARS